MEARPKVNLNLTVFDRLVELTGLLLLSVLWGYTIWNFSGLPNKIPVHFNGLGNVDAMGSRESIFVLPIIGTLLFFGMTLLNKKPHWFNYPVNITEHNAERQYRIATSLIRYVKVIIVLIFLVIVFKTIETATGEVEGLGNWFLPFILGAIFSPIIYSLVKTFKAR